MRKELDDSLCKRFPGIFAQRHAPLTDSPMCWGFDVGDGWYHLIDVLCEELQREAEQGAPQVVAAQVKEKYGGLRFYVDGASARQMAMIDFTEALSLRVCETCGAPGSLGQSRSGWWRTRCEGHANETPAAAQPE